MKKQNLVAIFFFLVFLNKEKGFILKNFWPYRPNVKGFSIEKLARKYREKVSSVSSNKNLSEVVDDDRDLNYFNKERNDINFTPISIKSGHWANRDFSEYRDVA